VHTTGSRGGGRQVVKLCKFHKISERGKEGWNHQTVVYATPFYFLKNWEVRELAVGDPHLAGAHGGGG